MKESEQGAKNRYLHEAVLDLEEYGYNINSLITKADEQLVWDEVNDEFHITNGKGDSRYREIRSTMPKQGCMFPLKK